MTSTILEQIWVITPSLQEFWDTPLSIWHDKGPKARWAVQPAGAQEGVFDRQHGESGEGQRKESYHLPGMNCWVITISWQWFLKSKLCLKTRQMSWQCGMLFWNATLSTGFFWAPSRFIWGWGGERGSWCCAGPKSRAWGLEENFCCRRWSMASLSGLQTLPGPEEYLTHLVSTDTQQSIEGKWKMRPDNEPGMLFPQPENRNGKLRTS